MESGGLVEKPLGTVEGMPTQGWTALATVDVNGDGYTDLITGGLGNVGCWLRIQHLRHSFGKLMLAV